jgi:hypothetical protein
VRVPGEPVSTAIGGDHADPISNVVEVHAHAVGAVLDVVRP